MKNTTEKKVTNVEFVTHLMEFHPSGALVQAFVIEALRFYSRMVGQQDPANFDPSKEYFVNPHAWRAIGVDVLQQVVNRTGSTDEDKAALEIMSTITNRLRKESAAAEKENAQKAIDEREKRPKYEH